MNAPVLPGQSFSTLSHTKTWHTNAASTPLHTVSIWRNQQRMIPYTVLSWDRLICTFSDHRQPSPSARKITLHWFCWKQPYIGSWWLCRPREASGCSPTVHIKTVRTALFKRGSRMRNHRSGKLRGWSGFNFGLFYCKFTFVVTGSSIYGNKLWGMNLKGFNTTDSRETSPLAGEGPTALEARAWREDETDGKPTELHGHSHHCYRPGCNEEGTQEKPLPLLTEMY